MARKEINISRDAVASQARFLAHLDKLVVPYISFEDRKKFWAEQLPRHARPNPNIRIASFDSSAVILGYLALDLPEEEAIGRERPGLNIVINPHFEYCIDARSELRKLGDLLCPLTVVTEDLVLGTTVFEQQTDRKETNA